ncbi:MAG: hypothetical protein R6X07_07830 [Desulfatiglandales bacterium]
MEKVFYNKAGKAVAYVAEDYRRTIYLWDGSGVAYLLDQGHIYGINGKHLGWFKDEVIYDNDGARVGFTSGTSPVPIEKTRPKGEKSSVDEIRPRWSAPPFPNLSFQTAGQDLADFLSQGRVSRRPDSKS